MIVPAERLIRVNKAWYADSERVVKDRLPGAFKRLVNIVPNLSDGIGQIRTGYQVYNSSNGGINFNVGDNWNTEIPFVFPIQNPQDTELFLLCQTGTGPNAGLYRVAIYPYYYAGHATNPIATTFNVADYLMTGEVAADDFTLHVSDKKIIQYDVANAANAFPAATLLADDYYTHWLVYNINRNNYAIATDFEVTAGAVDVTFLEDVHGATSLGWIAADRLVWFRNFHENPYHPTDALFTPTTKFSLGMNPKYNDDKLNPPTGNVQNSIVRFSGGVGTHIWNRGIHITSKLTRTFFPDAARPLAFAKEYVAERECKQIPLASLFDATDVVDATSGGGSTEVLVPAADTFLQNVTWTTYGSASAYTTVDDGTTPNDADYLGTGGVGGATFYAFFRYTSLTGTINSIGSTVTTFRYQVTAGGADKGRLRVELWDASGKKGMSETTPGNMGAIANLTLSVLNDTLDIATAEFRMEWIGSWSGITASINVYNIYATVDTMTETAFLEGDRTYWLAVAPVYDGFQIGKPLKVETVTDYGVVSGNWTNNYLEIAPGVLTLKFKIKPSTLNKRVTGLAIYCAVDDGYQAKRLADYQYMKKVSFVETDPHSATWAFDAASGSYTLSVTVNRTDIDTLGGTFTADSGYLIETFDQMYSYSIEEIVSGRRFMANTYVSEDVLIDRTHVFTNPTGGNPEINLGVIAPDIFPNEEATYKLRVEPLLGTKINAIVNVGVDEFLIGKDRGIVAARLVVPGDTPDLVQQVISRDVGFAAVNVYCKDDDGTLYFNGHDDVYAYRNGNLQPLIERPDKNDWLYTYRETVTIAQKESATMFWLPEMKSVMLLLDNTKGGTSFAQMQYLFHRGLWSEVALSDDTDFNLTPNLSMRWVTQLRNGHVLCTSTETTPAFYRMSWTTPDDGVTFNLTHTDNGVGIVPFMSTGDLLLAEESVDVVLRKVVVNRTMLGETLAGALDVTIYNEDGVGLAKTALLAADERLTLRFAPTTVRKGQSWAFVYNSRTTNKERATAGTYQINSIEYFGKKLPRVRSTGK
jgi:hypothetical protein